MLGIGLVVDDAIIVVENVNRHLEEGVAPVPAAINAARELGWPIIAMTVVLAAVYVPIGFQGGLTGALFAEFAFALVGAVTVSGVVALTLSPMLCSLLLKPHDPQHRGWEEKLTYVIDRSFNWLQGAYERRLHGSLNYLPVTVVFALIVLTSIYFLFITAHTELAPQEDQGVILSLSNAAPNATLKQRQLYAHEIYRIFFEHPETDHVFQIDVPGQSISGMALKPWDRRAVSTNKLQPIVQQEIAKISGCACRRLPAAAAAGQHRTAGSVRDRHDRAVRAPVQHCPGVSAPGAAERLVHLPGLRSENRQSAIQHPDRPRQDCAARLEDERRRRLARRHAGRRLRQLFQHERALL